MRYLCYLLLCLFEIAFCEEATLRARVTTSGLKFFSDIGHHVVDYETRKIEFPTISLPISGALGWGVVNLTNLDVVDIDSPIFDFKLAPPDGIAWKSFGGSITIDGLWYSMYQLIFPIYTSGTVRAVADDIRVLLQAEFYVQDNHLQIAIDSCSLSITKLDVAIGGGFLPWLVNLFRPEISRYIKAVIHNQLCTSLQTVLLDEANKALMSLPMQIRAFSNLYVNYMFLSNLVATTDYVEGEVYSNVVYGKNSCPLKPKAMNKEIIGEDRMVHFWVSEHIPNCLMLTAHRSRLLSFTITKDFDKGKFAKFMATSCSFLTLCIGRFMPMLSEKYPNKYIDFHFETLNAPQIEITENGILATAVLNLDLYISPWKQQASNLATLEVIIKSIIEPHLMDDKVCGVVKNTSVVINETYSQIGHFNQKIIDVFATLISKAIIVVVAPLLKIGVRLPLVDNITLSDNAIITTQHGYIRIDSDFVYV